MKSLSERYVSSHAHTHETFADLVFCALVVLVLFVMMLAIEVSQRVRADLAEIDEVTEIEVVENIETLSPEEVAELSERLQKQQAEMETQREQMVRQQQRIRELRDQIASQESQVQDKIAALEGEQRFTGATEVPTLYVAYDYDQDRFLFVRSKEFSEATTRNSGESDLLFLMRMRSELSALSKITNRQRRYTLDEAKRIFSAFSEYQQINPTEDSYSVSAERISVIYSVPFSARLVGDADAPSYAEAEIVAAGLEVYNHALAESEAMYPAASVLVLPNQRRVVINEVALTPKDFKDLLLAFGGRGVMLDFEGYTGSAPQWLTDEVL